MKPLVRYGLSFVLLLVLGAIIGSLWLLNNRMQEMASKLDAEPAQASSSVPDKTAGINRQVQDLNGMVSTLTQQMTALSSKLDTLAKAGAKQEQEQENLPAERNKADDQAPVPVDPEAEMARQLQLLENTLNDQNQYDQVWATDTTTYVEQAIQSSPELNIATSVDVQCGGTLCKVDSTLPPGLSQAQKDLFHVKLLQDLAEQMPRAITQIQEKPDGSVQFTVYMSRKGHYLPTETPPDPTVLLDSDAPDR